MEVMEERPPYVTFEMRGKEDRAASMALGHYVEKEVVYVCVRQLGSRDVLEQEYEDWIKTMAADVKAQRLPLKWFEGWQRMYEAWKKGEEIPENGTSLKMFPVIRPSQLSTCLSLGVRTVEDLASLNSDGQAKLGIGGLDLVKKAQMWLESASDKGKIVQRAASAEGALALANDRVKALEESNAELKARVEAMEKAAAGTVVVKS